MYNLNLLPESLTSKIKVVGACWVWQGTHVRDYGQRSWEGRNWLTHRLVYTLLVGPIPEGDELDHVYPICTNKGCCNPDHLEPVPHIVNMARGIRARKTHCRHGHPFDEANTYVFRVGLTERRCCRLCNKALSNRYYHTVRKLKVAKV